MQSFGGGGRGSEERVDGRFNKGLLRNLEDAALVLFARYLASVRAARSRTAEGDLLPLLAEVERALYLSLGV